MKDRNLETIIAEYQEYLKQHYGHRLVQVVLYGSQARGEAKPDSDIDLLIVLQDPVDSWQEIDQTGDFTSALCLKYEVVISRAFVPLSRFQQETSPFFRNVRREGVVV